MRSHAYRILASTTRVQAERLRHSSAKANAARFSSSREIEHSSHPPQSEPIIAEDLHGQHKALSVLNQALLQARRLYLDQFDFAPVAYLLTDAEGVIQEANLAAAKLLAARQHWLPDKSLALFLAPSEQALFQQALARWHQTGVPQAWDTSLCLPSGWMNDVHITIGSPPEWASTFNRLCSMCWSLQERAAPQDAHPARFQGAPAATASACTAAEQVDQAASAVLAAAQEAQMLRASAAQPANDPLELIVHDLQHPLTVIRGYMNIMSEEILKSGALDRPRLQKWLGEIEAASLRMSAQLTALLATSGSASAEQASAGIQPTDLVTLVRQTAEAYQQLTTAHVIEAVTPAMLIGRWDERRITQVLDNLLSNSIKYSPHGGRIRVTVALEVHQQQEWAAIAVQDQGIGIPTEDLDHIFEPFHRAEHGYQQIPGTGLGLASVHLLVEQLAGTIQAASAVGDGSTFVVRLPLQR